jgi:uncharacterized membrane protein YtjA (UPF0391 family)
MGAELTGPGTCGKADFRSTPAERDNRLVSGNAPSVRNPLALQGSGRFHFGHDFMRKLSNICLVIALVGGVVGFATGHPILKGLGKAIFGVFFEIFLIIRLFGNLDGDADKAKPSHH